MFQNPYLFLNENVLTIWEDLPKSACFSPPFPSNVGTGYEMQFKSNHIDRHRHDVSSSLRRHFYKNRKTVSSFCGLQEIFVKLTKITKKKMKVFRCLSQLKLRIKSLSQTPFYA